MASDIKLNKPHTLGRAAAEVKVEEHLRALAAEHKVPISQTEDGEEVRIKWVRLLPAVKFVVVRAKGAWRVRSPFFKSDGIIRFADRVVHVEVELSKLGKPLKGKIEHLIQQTLNNCLK